MAPQLRLNAVAFISPQNQPILIRTFGKQSHPIKYHYIAHTSLDVIEERGEFHRPIQSFSTCNVDPIVQAAGKTAECYLGLLYTMEDVAVYGYITPLKVKIVVALALSDAVVRDLDVITIFKALHMAYYNAISNPFLRLETAHDGTNEHSPYLLLSGSKWQTFKRRVDDISRLVGSAA
ncbi:hypothetical protein HGRIS_009960 [Hohenbuehelia grisea]|uniref:Trafficking protein particle complex subunit 2-like protein n=1 Tax=Hohenbuehelia grisea TaxID=104357 RepID=A0ABR3J353_9AGAR